MKKQKYGYVAGVKNCLSKTQFSLHGNTGF